MAFVLSIIKFEICLAYMCPQMRLQIPSFRKFFHTLHKRTHQDSCLSFRPLCFYFTRANIDSLLHKLLQLNLSRWISYWNIIFLVLIKLVLFHAWYKTWSIPVLLVKILPQIYVWYRLHCRIDQKLAHLCSIQRLMELLFVHPPSNYDYHLQYCTILILLLN